ncbi:DUF6233 domain-containing protein [Streptomyces sp. 1222.5]|uniref:DUF6233 domain-containing protein n=1 Tax=Streptomyces sp. 1222.5 TaxID=1881026 RepID=UPI003EC114A2
MNRFQFVADHHRRHGVKRLCAILGIVLAHLDGALAETEAVGIYLQLQRQAVQRALAATERPSRGPGPAPAPSPAHPAVQPPRPAGFMVEQRLQAGHPLAAAVHVAGCQQTERETRPVTAAEARQALTQDPKFFRPCEFCRPQQRLGTE